MKLAQILPACLLVPSVCAQVHMPSFDVMRQDSVAPLGIPYHDVLEPDDWVFRFTYRRNTLDGARDSRDDQSSQDLFGDGYSVAPTEGDESIYDFELLYGLDERWTLFAELPIVAREMDFEQSGGGADFSSDAGGLGDLFVGGIWRWRETQRTRTNVHVAVGVPTGAFDESDTYAGASGQLLPYPLQPGGGVWAGRLGISHSELEDTWSWGVGTSGTGLLGKNSDDWGQSRYLRFDAWTACPLTNNLIGSLRTQLDSWGDVHGKADELVPTRNPQEDSHRQGGARVDVFAGIALDLSDTEPGSNRLSLEIGMPVHEWLDGPALSREAALLFGWRVRL